MAEFLVGFDRETVVVSAFSHDTDKPGCGNQRFAFFFDLHGGHVVSASCFKIGRHYCQHIIRGNELNALQNGLWSSGGDDATCQIQRFGQRSRLCYHLHGQAFLFRKPGLKRPVNIASLYDAKHLDAREQSNLVRVYRGLDGAILPSITWRMKLPSPSVMTWLARERTSLGAVGNVAPIPAFAIMGMSLTSSPMAAMAEAGILSPCAMYVTALNLSALG